MYDPLLESHKHNAARLSPSGTYHNPPLPQCPWDRSIYPKRRAQTVNTRTHTQTRTHDNHVQPIKNQDHFSAPRKFPTPSQPRSPPRPLAGQHFDAPPPEGLHPYFLAAPKFVLTFFRLKSLSLSPPTSTLSPFLFSFLDAPPVFPAALLPPPPPPPAPAAPPVGVAWFDPAPGPKVLLAGVGAWLEPGVLAAESDTLALYEMDDREKTRWCSSGATLRRWAAAAVVPPLIRGSNPIRTLPLGVLSRYSLSLV